MTSYASCPTSDNGIHRVVYNKFNGKAYCCECGYTLIEIKSPYEDMEKGNRLQKSDMSRGFIR